MVEAVPIIGHKHCMNFGLRIFGAAARLFGPPQTGKNVSMRDIDNAGVAAALIALGAKLAKADGVVRPEEVDAFKNVFKASVESRVSIERFFNLAQQTTLGFEHYAKIVYRHYKLRSDILEDILDGLFFIALADGIVTVDEMNFLETIGKIFKFSPMTFHRIRAVHCGRAPDDPFLVLGIDERISDVELKRVYRSLAASNHPDRLAARGLPPELQKLATHKMAMINKAYAEIIEMRKNAPVFERLTQSQKSENA